MVKSKTPNNRSRGRPSIYSPELAADICSRLAQGDSLRSICKKTRMPAISTVMGWLFDDEHEEFSQQYARAREAQAELRADEIIDIADDAKNADKSEKVQAARLRVDARKWVASKLLPKVYGDRVQHTGAGGGPIVVDIGEALSEAITRARDQERRIAGDSED